MESKREQIVSVKDFNELNNSVKGIRDNLTELKPKKKSNLLALFALFVSVASLVYTMYSNYKNSVEQNNIQEKQKEILAYTTWQNFLSTALNYPDLANGIDSIEGKSNKRYSILDFTDSRKRMELKKDSTAYNKYLKYAWFVAYALGSAEAVYNLQKSDTAWKNTLIEALGGHKILSNTNIYPRKGYDIGFIRIIDEAPRYKKIK